MSAFVDTNVLVRHVTGDPPAPARRASRFLAGTKPLVLTDVIVAEVVYVLESVYGLGRSDVAQLTRVIVGSDRLVVVDEALLLRSLEIYEFDRIDFADSYVVASAERSGINEVVSFDRDIDRVGTVTRIAP